MQSAIEFTVNLVYSKGLLDPLPCLRKKNV